MRLPISYSFLELVDKKAAHIFILLLTLEMGAFWEEGILKQNCFKYPRRRTLKRKMPGWEGILKQKFSKYPRRGVLEKEMADREGILDKNCLKYPRREKEKLRQKGCTKEKAEKRRK